ncbi:MAG: alpha/beta fold hydrolase [Nitrosomonadales bacterium]|nr:alpha/beta fold hydrolase [Nitrosomonadales bacterium]
MSGASRTKRILYSIARIALAAYAGLCLLLFATQRSHIYFPTQAGPVQAGDITLDTGDASLHITARPRDGARALIYFGGNAEDVTYALPEFAAAFPDHAIYMMNYRGYGRSTGQPSEEALHKDARLLFEKVRTKHTDIVLVGRSLGSGVATRLAAGQPVSRLVLVTPYDSLLNLAKRNFPYLPVGLILLDTFESWRFAPQVKCPTLIIAAADDEIIPMENTRALYRAFTPGVATLRTIAHTGHNTVSDSPEYIATIRAGASPSAPGRKPTALH